MTKTSLKKAQEYIDKFLKKKHKKTPLVVIVGSTASGKTGLSVQLAKKFKGEIISADSRQIYKYLNIGSAKVTKEETKGVPHHAISVVKPDEDFNLSHFKKLTEEKIADITKRGKIPFLVGGTSLWIDAVVKNFNPPEAKPDKVFREKMMKLWEKDKGKVLWEKLNKVDPASAKKIPPENRHHLIRQLEIIKQTGIPSSQQKNTTIPKFDSLVLGLSWPRKTLCERIEKRVDIMMKQGLLRETKKIYKKYKDPNLPALKGIGYRELIEYLDKKITKEEAVAKIKQDTRAYSKRQMTWWKRDKKIKWIKIK